MNPIRMARIQRVSGVMKVVVAALTVILAGLYTTAFLMVAEPLYPLSARPLEWTWTMRAVVFGIGALPFGCALFAMATAARLFGAFASGAIFSPRTGALLSRIGITVLVGVVLGILAPTAAGTVIANAGGTGSVSIGISWQDVWAASLSLLLIVTGWVLREAAAMADDHRAII